MVRKIHLIFGIKIHFSDFITRKITVRHLRPSSYIFKNTTSADYYSCPRDENMSEAGIGCTEQAINEDSYFKNLKY